MSGFRVLSSRFGIRERGAASSAGFCGLARANAVVGVMEHWSEGVLNDAAKMDAEGLSRRDSIEAEGFNPRATS